MTQKLITRFLISSDIRPYSIIYTTITTFIKWVDKLRIKYSYHEAFTMSMKMKDNSFSYRGGYVYATISHNLKAYSLIDSLFIFSILRKSFILRVTSKLSPHYFKKDLTRLFHFFILKLSNPMYQLKQV
jgi:hypothetical protein